MKRIIISESQFNNLIKEYLDKDKGMPLYRYLMMNMKDKTKYLIFWGLSNGYVKDYYTDDEGNGYEDLWEYFNENIEKDEEIDEYDQFSEFCEHIFYDMEYDYDAFFDFIWKDYDLQNSLYSYLDEIAHNMWYEAPAFVFFSSPRLVKNKWLVHFSNGAYSIAKEGFKYGTEDLDRLAYSGCGDISNKFGSGYDFAYLADNANDSMYISGNHVDSPKYGDELVLFQASGVEAYHDGDQERQVIFYGPSAKNIIYIRNEYGNSEKYRSIKVWQVCDVYNKRVIYENEDLENVIDWAIKNYAQYRRRIVSLN